MAGPPPSTRPPMVARSNSLPSRPSSTNHHRPSSSSRPRRAPTRPSINRASTSLASSSRLRTYSSLIESDESDEDDREGRNQFCRRYLSRKNSFESDEEDYVKRTESPGLMGRWGRAYLPFASRPSSRSSSISTTSWHGRPFTSAPPTIPTGIHTPRRSPSSSSTPWSSHLGKTPATLGLITPTLEILSWPLSPDPSTSSSRPHRQHHARIHRTSLLLQRPIAKSSTLSAPAYPSPAGSDTTIRPSRVSYYPTCSPPPFRRAHSSTSSTSSEEDSVPSSEPTSYSSYLRAGRPSPDGDRDRDRTPRADGRGGRRWAEQTSPTRLRRGEKVPSLSFTTGSSRSSVSVSVGGSPTDVFSVRAGRGGGLKGSGS